MGEALLIIKNMKSSIKSAYKLMTVGGVLAVALFAFAGSVSASNITPDTMGDWTIYGNTDFGTFVIDEDTSNGAVEFNTPAREDSVGLDIMVTPTAIADLGNMNYVEKGISGAPHASPAYVLGIDTNDTGNVDMYAWYEPVYNGGTDTSAWQTYTLDKSTTQFWSHTTVGTKGGANGANLFTLEDVVAAYPNAKVAEVSLNQGSGNDGWITRVDSLIFNGTTYDFGPASAPITVYVDADSSCDSQTPCFASVQDAIDTVADNGTILITSDITTASQINITKAITLDGGSHKLLATFSDGVPNSTDSVIYITSNGVTIKNLVEDATDTTGNRGINIYRVTGVLLDNVTAENNSKNGIVVNGSTVIVNNITTKNNGWEGMNVDKGTLASLTVRGTSSHTGAKAAIRIDDTSTGAYTVTDTDHQYSHVDTGNTRDYFLLETGQTTPNEDGTATVTDTNKEVVVTATTPITVSLGSVEDATIDFDSLIDDSTGVGIIPQTTINSDVATVEIPADTTVTALGWDGVMQAPTVGDSSGTAPAGFSVGDNVIEMGSSEFTLTFNQAVKITLPGVTGTVGYRPASSTVWQTITTQCTSATVPGITSGECSIPDGLGNTIIWTYHFTSFGEMIPDPDPTPAPGRSGGHRSNVNAATPAVPGVSPAIPSINSNNNAIGEVLGAETFNFSRNLNSGTKGDDVTELQNRLTAEGVYNGPITGYFGSLTAQAVKAYQSKVGVSSTGYVGPLTLAKLNSVGAVLGAQTTDNAAVSAQVTAIKTQIATLIQQLIQMLQDQIKTQQN